MTDFWADFGPKSPILGQNPGFWGHPLPPRGWQGAQKSRFSALFFISKTRIFLLGKIPAFDMKNKREIPDFSPRKNPGSRGVPPGSLGVPRGDPPGDPPWGSPLPRGSPGDPRLSAQGRRPCAFRRRSRRRPAEGRPLGGGIWGGNRA